MCPYRYAVTQRRLLMEIHMLSSLSAGSCLAFHQEEDKENSPALLLLCTWIIVRWSYRHFYTDKVSFYAKGSKKLNSNSFAMELLKNEEKIQCRATFLSHSIATELRRVKKWLYPDDTYYNSAANGILICRLNSYFVENSCNSPIH